MAQWENLPSIREALGFISSATKNKNKIRCTMFKLWTQRDDVEIKSIS